MEIRKGTPPTTVERKIEVDLTREETLAVIVNHIKTKLGPNYKFSDIKVAGDENDKLQSVSVSGVELIPINWKEDEATAIKPVTPVTPPTPIVKPK